jgi:type II secretory pathway pseudopilin PulG
VRWNFRAPKTRGSGFSLLEMILATAILMVGILSVVQLVPASLQSDLHNRLDTMATVTAQRELDQMLSQPLWVNSFADKDNTTINMGGPGAPVVKLGSNAVIDFSVHTDQLPAGYYKTYKDPYDPMGAVFELRWAVIPQTNNGLVISKRIIIGCRQTNASQPMLPVNLDSSVQR